MGKGVLGFCAVFFLLFAFSTFGKDLTVQEAIKLALSNHPDIRRAELQLSLAQLQLSAAQARTFFPSISLTLGPSGELFPTGTISASASWPFGTSNRFTGRLLLQPAEKNWNITWNIAFSLGLNLSNPMAAAETLVNLTQAVEDARASLEKTKATVVTTTLKSYADILALKAKMDQAKAAKDKAAQNLAKTEEKVKSGLSSSLDLLQARLSLIQAELNLVQAQENYETQKSRFLKEYLGITEDTELVPFSLDTEALKQAAEELLKNVDLEAAVEGKSEVRTAKLKVEAAQEALEQARLSWLPTLSFEVGLGPKGLTFGWSVQFDLFLPDRNAQIRMAEVQLALAELALASARSTARQELSNLVTSLRSALEALARLPLEKEQWDLQEEINRAKYAAGTLSESDWLDFQREKEAFMVEAQGRSVTLLLAYLNLRAALGLSVDWEDWLR